MNIYLVGSACGAQAEHNCFAPAISKRHELFFDVWMGYALYVLPASAATYCSVNRENNEAC